MKRRTTQQPQPPREPYIEIEQRDVKYFRWQLHDGRDPLGCLYLAGGQARSLAAAERQGAKALRRHLKTRAVQDRKWTLKLEEA